VDQTKHKNTQSAVRGVYTHDLGRERAQCTRPTLAEQQERNDRENTKEEKARGI